MNETTIEAIAQWIWGGFNEVDDIEDKNWILDVIEAACLAADNGEFIAAWHHLDRAANRVFGCYSEEYAGFVSLAGRMGLSLSYTDYAR